MSKAERIKAEKTKEIRALIAGYLIMLAPGGNDHSGPGENRQL